jgi:hypothetical protein
VDLRLVPIAGLAPGTGPTLAEPDEFIFVSGVVARIHEETLSQTAHRVDYNRAGGLE